MSRYTARITYLDPATTEIELVGFLQGKGLATSPGQSRISLATGLEGSKIATATFETGEILSRALKLTPQERLLHDRHVTLDDTFEGFTPLSDGDKIDIVALHGLNGHAFDTWQYHSSDDCFMWLRDSLPEHFPGARVLTYGYNANVISDVSTGRLRTFAETFLERLRQERDSEGYRHKPLVLMAHSMGGLVLKQALIVGSNRADMRYKDLLESIHAVMFFGTPHQGGNGVSTAEFLTNLLHAVNLDARSDLIRELNPNSLFLFDLTGDFRQVIESLHTVICTFVEGKETKIGRWPLKRKLLIVQEQSAILGVARERKTSVNANHSDICKFKGPGDAAYATVRQVLRELIVEITPVITARDANDQPPPPSDLKYTTNDGDWKKYPVLEWGAHTYWALSHIDNRYGMTIVAYDKQGRIAGRWEKAGARYIHSIKMDRERVEFVGQGEYSITFALKDLKIT
ncbi:Alpha/Beta hydrolase protein [Rhodocollybia butyracea]|uniref:Alpha/Beta hydrolase protein n=1 Tax=Rhodocollybia butyracea TaxID=206335 RepID=A0A9P5U3T2_9AGAR|nr:Alpha/Beta hydrolase protein [Rhodocollybia butyracea]